MFLHLTFQYTREKDTKENISEKSHAVNPKVTGIYSVYQSFIVKRDRIQIRNFFGSD